MMLAACCAGLFLWGMAGLDRQAPNFSRIEDGLYQGGFVAQPPPGTRAVLNLCAREDPYRTDAHLWEPISDSEPAPGIDWLRRMVAFVAANRKQGRTTFVHCRNGVSRSGLVVTAYLMSEHGWTRDEALAFVRSKRALTRPNPAFLRLLADWERALKRGFFDAGLLHGDCPSPVVP